MRKKTARLKALRMERDAALQEAKVTEASLPSEGEGATGKRPRARRNRRGTPGGE
jgi:hypothetical protein